MLGDHRPEFQVLKDTHTQRRQTTDIQSLALQAELKHTLSDPPALKAATSQDSPALRWSCTAFRTPLASSDPTRHLLGIKPRSKTRRLTLLLTAPARRCMLRDTLQPTRVLYLPDIKLVRKTPKPAPR